MRLKSSANCRISGSCIEDSIIESDCVISNAALKGCFIGARVNVHGRGLEDVLTLNVGDDSTVRLVPSA